MDDEPHLSLDEVLALSPDAQEAYLTSCSPEARAAFNRSLNERIVRSEDARARLERAHDQRNAERALEDVASRPQLADTRGQAAARERQYRAILAARGWPPEAVDAEIVRLARVVAQEQRDRAEAAAAEAQRHRQAAEAAIEQGDLAAAAIARAEVTRWLAIAEGARQAAEALFREPPDEPRDQAPAR